MTTALLLAVSSTSFAQNKYYPFQANKKYGATDTLGNELVKPIHKFREVFPSGKEFALYNFSDEIKDLIVNASTGKIQSFAYIVPSEATINGASYTIIRENDKRYLRSEEDGKIIILKKDYTDFFREGKYIVAKHYPDPPPPPPARPAPKPVKINGKLIPPPPLPPPPPPKLPPIGFDGYSVIGANDLTLKPVMTGIFKQYLALYKDEQENMAERIVIKKRKAGEHSDFYAIIFSTDHTHSLYDSSMKLVKKFELKDAQQEQLEKIASDIMKTPLSNFDRVNSPAPMGLPSKNRPVPEIVYPVFEVVKADNGNNQLILKRSATEVKVIFESPNRISWDPYKHIAGIPDTDTEFNISPQTGKIFLPQKYREAAGIIVK
ncbi:hypothetical protein SAMN04488128_10340 [Chitinophaga eiseniae]|uniref:WG containing repeat-containing protein n=2 Tax=Chitinophaga eiseniae TaxID=634771 RepID=A0A1T4SL76_9BACT|nr:hypothetical protein SAMN04488128_10340 [Chitinophaga eiseniae]